MFSFVQSLVPSVKGDNFGPRQQANHNRDEFDRVLEPTEDAIRSIGRKLPVPPAAAQVLHGAQHLIW